MNDFTEHDPADRVIRCAVVIRVREDECEVLREGRLITAQFASMFPAPRTERVQPGNLVAMTATSDGTETVLWRWYDGVVLEDGPEAIRLWEPAHGEVLAQARPAYIPRGPGTRASCPRDFLAQTGGWRVPLPRTHGTPMSNWTRSTSCSPRTACGTPLSELALRSLVGTLREPIRVRTASVRARRTLAAYR